ncbi:hypothetical protein AB0J48_22705 [Nocardia salmonicida]|uniref:hypothetical protein n=1 Tax=Nocardia TaxID=1817 RepID=UPI0007010DFF|nr:hypothetical protein [Nocardia sp. Root136]KQY38526.1 hypothetical protein ASD42_09020 [Nocardia sp. Root136]
MERSALISVGSFHVGDAEISQVLVIQAEYRSSTDVVCVDFGSTLLLATVADAATLIDQLTAALDARTSTLRAVA